MKTASGLRSGSSFFLAARLLPASVRQDAVALYAFCRRVDDLADEAACAESARRSLAEVRRALREGDRAAEPEILDLIRRRRVPANALLQLIDAVEGDLGAVRLASDEELMDYCYGVAGTVGVAMCAVLGVARRPAPGAAVDLGVAMQLGNIARDVLEDAARGRLYLPADALASPITPGALVAGDRRARRAAYDAACRLVRRSETLYARADRGLHHIPPTSRPAILVAARAYRAVGRRVLALGPERYWRGRARLGPGARLGALAAAGLALPATFISGAEAAGGRDIARDRKWPMAAGERSAWHRP